MDELREAYEKLTKEELIDMCIGLTFSNTQIKDLILRVVKIVATGEV